MTIRTFDLTDEEMKLLKEIIEIHKDINCEFFYNDDNSDDITEKNKKDAEQLIEKLFG